MKRSYLPWFLALLTICLLIPQTLTAGNKKSGPRAVTAAPPITVILPSTPQLTAVDPYSNAVSSSDGLKPARPFWYSVDQNGLTILRMDDNKVVYTIPWPLQLQLALPTGDGPDFMTINAPPTGWQPVGIVVTYPTEEQLASTSETPATYVFVVMAHSGYEWKTNLAPPDGQDLNVRDMIVPSTNPLTESSLLVEVDVTDPTYPIATYPTGPSVVAALLGHGAGQPAFDPATGNVYVGNMPSRSLPMSTAVSKDLTSFVSVIMPIAMGESAAAAEPAVGVPDPPLVLCGPEHPDEGLLASEPYVWPCTAEGGEGELVWEFQNLPPWVNVHLDKISREPDGILYGIPPTDGTWIFQVKVTDLGEDPANPEPNSSDWTSVTLNVTPTGVAGEAEAGFETDVAGGQGVAGTGDCTPGPTSTPGSLVPNWIDVQPALINGVMAGCYVMGTAPVSGEYYEFTLPNFKFAYPFDREPVVFSGYVAGTYGFDPLPQGVGISGLAWHQIEKIHDPSTEADILNAEFIGIEPLTGQLYQILMPQGVIEGSEAVVGPPEISVELDKITPEGQPLLTSLEQLRPDIMDALGENKAVAFGDLAVETDRDMFVSAPWILNSSDGSVVPIGGPAGSPIEKGALLKVNSTGVSVVDLPGVQSSFLALNSDLRPAIPGSEPGQKDNGVLWVAGTNTGGVAVVDTALGQVGADQLLSVAGASSLAGVAVDTGTAAAYVAAPLLSSVAIFNNAYLPRAPEIWLGIEATATFDIGTPGTFSVLATGTPYPKMSYSGALPSGVNFVDNGDGTATFSGTAAEGSGGDYTITVMAANGISPDAAESFVLTVPLAPQITSAATATFTEGQAGTFTVTSIGAPGPVGLTITATLPEGVTFTDNEDGTAALAGTPAAGTVGTYVFDITAATSTGYPPNAIQSFTLTVLPGTGGPTDTVPSITSAAGTSVTVGQPISFQITASGTPAPTFTYSGALPSGVLFYPYSGMAILVGTPAAGSQATYPLTITATNRAGSVNQSFTLTVNPSAQTAPAITSANSADFKVGVPGSFTVIATGAPTPALSAWGSLPGGVTFVDNGNGTATLGGTPATSGNFMFTITATNSVSNATQNFTLRVAAANPNLSVSPSSLSFAYTIKGATPSAQSISVGSSGSALSYTVSASAGTWLSASAGGTTPGSVSVSVNPSALAAGTYNGTVTITSSGAVNSPQTVAVSLTVNPAPTLNVSPSALSFAYTIGGSNPAAQSIAVSSSGTALSYTVSSSAAWLTVDSGGNTPGNVSVSINPSGLAAGTHSGTVTITSSGAANSPQTVAVTLTVNPQAAPLQITTTSLPDGTVGQQYSAQLHATGGVKPYTWSLSNRRSLPNSFNLSSAGVLSGKPNAAGTYTFTVNVRDASSNIAGQSLTLIVNVRPPRR